MFNELGWKKFNFDAKIARWAKVAHIAGCEVLKSPKMRAKWLQCQQTWFVGVDALPSDSRGSICDIPLEGLVIDFLSTIEAEPLHPAQLSIIFEGYPKPRKGEGKRAFNYRLKRDAAHVDGLLPVGSSRRRMLKEPHAYILGLPLNVTSGAASPVVVWEGSHIIIAETFKKILKNKDPSTWEEVDLTAVYQTARRNIFETCSRTELHASPGEAYVIHKLALHGVAPWGENAIAPREGRMIAYLRPKLKDPSLWLCV